MLNLKESQIKMLNLTKSQNLKVFFTNIFLQVLKLKSQNCQVITLTSCKPPRNGCAGAKLPAAPPRRQQAVASADRLNAT